MRIYVYLIILVIIFIIITMRMIVSILFRDDSIWDMVGKSDLYWEIVNREKKHKLKKWVMRKWEYFLYRTNK
jgi:5-bromo-4-chloroindolyl phosphate hydrolysis protein